MKMFGAAAVCLTLFFSACGQREETPRSVAVATIAEDQEEVAAIAEALRSARNSEDWATARGLLAPTVTYNRRTAPADAIISEWQGYVMPERRRTETITGAQVTIEGDAAQIVSQAVVKYELDGLDEARNFWEERGRLHTGLERHSQRWLVTTIEFVRESEAGDDRVMYQSAQQILDSDFVRSLNGAWSGTYCGNSSTQWSISTSDPDSAWAREYWCNGFACGDLDFRLSGANASTRTFTALAYYGEGFSSTGFTIDFRVSPDGRSLTGDYNQHPRCDHISMSRRSDDVVATPLSQSTPASIFTSAARPRERTPASSAPIETPYECWRRCVATGDTGVCARMCRY